MAPERAPAAVTVGRRAFLGGLIAGAGLLSACGGSAPVAEASYDRRRLAYGTRRHQEGDLTVPVTGGPHPVVVLIHGGYWKQGLDHTSLAPLAESLSRQGFAVWNVDYRTIGDDGGGWPGTFEDVALAIDHLGSLPAAAGLDLSRVVTVGHSAGGHLALWSAARGRLPRPDQPTGTGATAATGTTAGTGPGTTGPAGTIPPGTSLRVPRPEVTVAGVVSLAGVPDLAAAATAAGAGNPGELRRAVVELLGGTPEEVPARYAQASPRQLLPLGVPQLLVHGTRDDRVPWQQAREFSLAATRAGDEALFIEVPTGDHGDITRADWPAWPQVVAWLADLAHRSA